MSAPPVPNLSWCQRRALYTDSNCLTSDGTGPAFACLTTFAADSCVPWIGKYIGKKIINYYTSNNCDGESPCTEM